MGYFWQSWELEFFEAAKELPSIDDEVSRFSTMIKKKARSFSLKDKRSD